MYGCDCDGITRDQLDRGGQESASVRSHLATIERITGHRPPTCPWRSMYEPIVREVLEVAWAVEEGNLGPVLGPDPDFVLVQAMGVYRRSLNRATLDERTILREEADAKRKAAAHARRANG